MAGTLSHFGRAKRLTPSAVALPLSLIAVAAIFTVLKPAFISLDNVVGIVHRMATTGIMAEGMTFVIMTGGIDLSVGPVLAIAGLVSFFSLQSGARSLSPSLPASGPAQRSAPSMAPRSRYSNCRRSLSRSPCFQLCAELG